MQEVNGRKMALKLYVTNKDSSIILGMDFKRHAVMYNVPYPPIMTRNRPGDKESRIFGA